MTLELETVARTIYDAETPAFMDRYNGDPNVRRISWGEVKTSPECTLLAERVYLAARAVLDLVTPLPRLSVDTRPAGSQAGLEGRIASLEAAVRELNPGLDL